MHTMLAKARNDFLKSGEMPIAILVPGDLNAHDMTATNLTAINPLWPVMIQTMNKVFSLIGEYFPGIPILPSIGNNDVYYKNSAPNL